MNKRLSFLFILIFTFQIWANADDIADFEIEGLSVGESLLDNFSEKEILSNVVNYHYTSDKYYVISLRNLNYLKMYDTMDIYLKKNDKKYIIYSIDAANFYDDIDKCTQDMDSIELDISKVFTSPQDDDNEKMKNEGDPTGKSVYYRSDWEINNGDLIAVECYFWSQEMKDAYNFGDHLRISATKLEIDDWLRYEAFK